MKKLFFAISTVALVFASTFLVQTAQAASSRGFLQDRVFTPGARAHAFALWFDTSSVTVPMVTIKQTQTKSKVFLHLNQNDKPVILNGISEVTIPMSGNPDMLDALGVFADIDEGTPNGQLEISVNDPSVLRNKIIVDAPSGGVLDFIMTTTDCESDSEGCASLRSEGE